MKPRLVKKRVDEGFYTTMRNPSLTVSHGPSGKRYRWPTRDAEYHTHYILERLSSGMGVPYTPISPRFFRAVPRVHGGIKYVSAF